jgi:hypothetical protein
MVFRAPIALLAFALAGCAGQVRVGHGDVTPLYDRSVVVHASKGGVFPLVVHGAPGPGLTPAEVAAAVARDLRLPGWFEPARFGPAPASNAPAGDWRLVLIFNPARPVSAAEACGDLGRVPVLEPEGETVVRAAFCTRGDAGSDVAARAPASEPGTPGFRALLDQIAAAVFPERNPSLQGESGDFPA